MNSKNLTDGFAYVIANSILSKNECVLQTLSLADNRIGDRGVMYLAAGMLGPSSSINSSSSTDNIKGFRKMTCSTLEHLSLGQNSFSDDGVRSLSLALLGSSSTTSTGSTSKSKTTKCSSRLEYLNLAGAHEGGHWSSDLQRTNVKRGAGISDVGCGYLAEMLAQNRKLAFLDISDHPLITEKGAKLIADALSGSRSENDIALEDIHITVSKIGTSRSQACWPGKFSALLAKSFNSFRTGGRGDDDVESVVEIRNRQELLEKFGKELGD